MAHDAEHAVLNGARLLSWARRSAAELERRRAEINELNVFPVRDADTGSNMAHTMTSAVAEAEKCPEGADVTEVAQALAVGSMRGARGNSGVVLSQVIRAVAQTVEAEVTNGLVVADALSSAVQFVDRAISEPVEGTVVTVLRSAAVAAREQLEHDSSLPAVSGAALDAARAALAATPSQLEVLREAGVVDAGGTGLVILLEALVHEIDGARRPGTVPSQGQRSTTAVASHAQPAELEVMFWFEGDLDALEKELSALGDCLVIARAGETSGKVHIHSFEAGTVIETAFAAGAVTDLRLEVLPASPQATNPERLIVAVTPPGSLASLYSEAGAVTVTPGDDVVADVLATIRRSSAREVILLPNGLLTSRRISSIEKSARAFGQTVTVLPTVRLVSGIAALAVHDANQPLSTVAYTMSEAAGEMRTAALQRAEIAGLVQGGAVSKGDLIVVAHGEISLAPTDPLAGVEFACRRMLEHGGEQVSILYAPEEFARFDADPLAAALDVDVLAYPADGLGAVAEIGVE
ncbi:DAK2 domain-containing protein [Corynebacterium sp. LK2510]|uniref:DAK2 domain-containing protein n=1 Tax=Corynebacterium sp. LK2510 TaxID=3110472 RepID=UPI0034CF3436